MILDDLENCKNGFTDWWAHEKEKNPKEAAVGSLIVGSVSSATGVAAIGNGLNRLISGENTYSVVVPILTITGGLVFNAIGIKSLSECRKIYKEIKAKEAFKEKEEKE